MEMELEVDNKCENEKIHNNKMYEQNQLNDKINELEIVIELDREKTMKTRLIILQIL
jgi:hypothetical protein